MSLENKWETEMCTFKVLGVATRTVRGRLEIGTISANIFSVNSPEEARGHIHKLAMKEFPPSQDWCHHYLGVQEYCKEGLEMMLGSARAQDEIPTEYRIPSVVVK